MANDDLIRRADALRLLDENGVVFRREFEELPTVDAVPVVHGKWYLRLEGTTTCMTQCSECEDGFYGDVTWWAFCPNCGAKMDGWFR